MDSTSSVALPELPVGWTPTDQRIMEHLLLDQSGVADDGHNAVQEDAANSPRTVELSRAEVKQSVASTKSKTKPKAKAAPTSDEAKQAEEDRRARHRAVQKRFMQRKKAEMERTKTLAKMLEQKYRYLEISAEERKLLAENHELQGRVDTAAASVPTVPDVDPVQLLMQMELVREFYEPLTQQALTSAQHNAQHEYELSRRDDTFLSSGASVMGWSDFRKVEESSIKFVLSKGFPNARALHLMNFTWDTLSTPSTYGRFFNPAFPVKVSDEYVIFDSALQHNAVQQCLGASYKWTQMTTSLGFTPLDANHNSGCLLRHGGWIRTSTTNAKYWLMEMFFMALRYESTMVAPVFALPSEE
ncbi:unnamed protein product [Phytophthora fragariaefolia]|uniref:Unnamed protein product n=1 Tax=Phytophthora fragariaefolia TaxID=1490495 RepID=A0A9W6YJX4_9STRA|nr:unnamed protein product [Phytophthora fragariaefolia]